MPPRQNGSVACRLLLAPERWQERAPLDARQRRYLVDVHRLSDGAAVEVFDGRGRRCKAILSRARGEWVLEFKDEVVSVPPPPPVRLAFALTKGRMLDEVVRMATEIGVSSLEPFLCHRSVPRPQDAEAERRRRRWETIATEAARQSGQTWLPRVCPLSGFQQMLSARGSDVGLMLHPEADEDLSDLLSRSSANGCLLLVGPEGGFAPAETEAARKNGFLLARLQFPVLRAATAAVVAAVLARLDRFVRLG